MQQPLNLSGSSRFTLVRARWSLHPYRSVLSFLEGQRVGFPYSVHRTGRRNQPWDALSCCIFGGDRAKPHGRRL